MAENEPNDVMSEFRKLQKETIGIRSVFAEKLPFNSTKMMDHKLNKDLQNLCEKAIKRQDDQDEVNKKLIEELRKIREEASEAKRNQGKVMKRQDDQNEINKKLVDVLRQIREEMSETKTNQEQMMKRQDDQDEINKNLIDVLSRSRKEASETKKNQKASMNTILAEFQSVRNELEEMKKKQSAQDQVLKKVQNELRMLSESKKESEDRENSVVGVTNPAKFQSIQKESTISENNQQVQSRAMKRPLSGPRMPSENKKMAKMLKGPETPTSSYRIFIRIIRDYKAFEVEATDTIKDLKMQIKRKEGIPIHSFWLCYSGRPLDDHRNLSDYNIKEEEKIDVNIRLRYWKYNMVFC